MSHLPFFHRGSSETTFILNERVYDKNSDSSSKKLPKLHKKYSGDDNLMDLRQFDDADKELYKTSGKGDQVSTEDKDVKSAKDVIVVMKDESVDRMIEKLKKANNNSFFPSYFWNSSLHDLTRRLGATAKHKARTLPGYAQIKRSSGMPAWKLFHRNIRQFSLYDPDDPNLYGMLIDMATLPMIEAEESDGGTMLKLIVRFKNEGRALVKFMRYPREVDSDENIDINDEIERHVAKIAAFQLDKVNGVRYEELTTPRLDLVVNRRVVGNTGAQYVEQGNPVLQRFGQEQANQQNDAERKEPVQNARNKQNETNLFITDIYLCFVLEHLGFIEYPQRLEDGAHHKAYWETHDDLCDSIRNESPYNNGKLFLDIIDAHTFDFLSGNQDRHGFTTFKDFGHYTFPILYDNGCGFGRQTYDAMSILAPLRQCCLIRKSTLLKYVKLYVGTGRLSVLMEKALESDPIAPVLIKPHLNALDRRLLKMLQAVAECIQKHLVNEVVVSDRF
ncbi:extracellular serine/threonine protein kinase FAM20C-like [Mercenaria mercenaria]|uniref:extracellular serine/threonine protein kinase FAM20C-like n=1 Tax=Mercenaria mercenaria TaxID=6596 RepID=UPI00234F7A9A|nr:extracellular serine/threonine protein kinase FAM20C-like [Mercenaria mercenaria]